MIYNMKLVATESYLRSNKKVGNEVLPWLTAWLA